MVKIKFRLISLIIISSALIICIPGCDNNQTFSGSRTSNDNQFLVDFDVLNSTVNSKMPLSKGEKIETTIVLLKGVLDIIVKSENDTIAYQGNDVESCKFIIEIEEKGTYTFYVTGYKAKGSVYFIKS
ncbi:MAG TPA: hypothetical protein PLW63_04455 [Bacillota bacterium]|nr:hypothetical protein [Bacillota bacterium]HQJ24581.1 hypothetical protein [Bacillota bacterium]